MLLCPRAPVLMAGGVGIQDVSRAEVFRRLWQIIRQEIIRGACFGSMYTKIRMIQRRLVWPLHKDDTLICEVMHTSVFNGYRVSVWENDSLEMDDGDGSATL